MPRASRPAPLKSPTLRTGALRHTAASSFSLGVWKHVQPDPAALRVEIAARIAIDVALGHATERHPRRRTDGLAAGQLDCDGAALDRIERRVHVALDLGPPQRVARE